MTDINLEYFLDKVDEHSIWYNIITRPLMRIFKSYIWYVLRDPNNQASLCTCTGDTWYISLNYGEGPECTAENMALHLQDGGNIKDFADSVISGRRG